MGIVYEAEDLKLGRRVAIKFLPGDFVADVKVFERFEREARAASALDHRNICSIYQLSEHEGQPFIVMQLLEGQTLREWIETAGSLSRQQRVQTLLTLAIQIADGLETAHQKGIIHRDIKPANIFITTRGEAKILDFGIAKFLETFEETAELTARGALSEVGNLSETNSLPNPALTQTGVSMGTPSYLSPEQIRGDQLNARTDLFSLGLVLYEAATGTRAFAGDTTADIRSAIINKPPVPVRQINPGLPAELERIINKALAKNRDQRYTSARQLQLELEQLQSHLAPVRNTLARKWLGLVAVVLLIGTSYWIGARMQFWRPTHTSLATSAIKVRRSVAVLGFKNLAGKPDEDWRSTAFAEMLSAELATGQQLRTIPGENVARMKLDLSLPSADSYGRDTLNKIGNLLGADLVVAGSYLAVGRNPGGKVRIDLRLQDVKQGETIAVISQEGTEDDLGGLISQSGTRLRQKLGLGAISANEEREVQASIPSNSEAVRLYSEGLAKLRVFDALAARDLLQRAIAADPNHALSHSALAESWSELGYVSKARAEAKIAFDQSSDLSRAERFLVEGRYRELLPDFPAAIEIYRTLRNFFPDDIEYGLRLAYAQSRGASAKDALQTVARMRSLAEPVNRDSRIDLAEAKAAENLGDFPLMQRSAAAAAAKAQSLGSPQVVAEAEEQEGWAWARLGKLDKAMNSYSQAREIAASSGNPNRLATVLYGIGSAYMDNGNYADALKYFTDSERIYRQVGSMDSSAYATSGIGSVLFIQGKYVEAKKFYESALKVHRELANPIAMGQDYGNIANTLFLLGEVAKSIRMQEQSLQFYRQAGDKLGEATTLTSLAETLFENGDLDAAKRTLDEATDIEKQSGNKLIRGYLLFSMSQILVAEDRLKEAQAAAEQALELRKEHSEQGLVAASQLQRAEMFLEMGNAVEAESVIRGASEVFDKDKNVEAGTQAAALAQQTRCWRKRKRLTRERLRIVR